MRAAVSSSFRRQLIAEHLMFVLAAVLTCVVVALTLAGRGTLFEQAALVALAPMALSLVGAVWLGRSVGLNENIDSQLRAASCAGDALDESLQPVPFVSAAAQGWNAVVRELRDRSCLRRLNERLAGSLDVATRDRWVAVFDSLSDGVAVVDSGGRILECNRAFRVLLGMDAEKSPAGERLVDLLAARAGGRQEAVAALRKSMAEIAVDVLLGECFGDGVWRIARSPLLVDDFGAGCSLWTVRDVTQQRLSEEARGQFVYTATHELRTPLANIKAYAETLTLQDGVDVERQKVFCNIINDEATRLARFVDDLLNVSQMEAGAMGLVARETDVERLVREAAEHIRPSAEKKRQRFDVKFPAKFPILACDKDKLEASLVNLLGNAVKYTPEGGEVVFSVETAPGRIDFVVEDTGIGVDAASLARLGEKFFRVDDPRVRAESGSGLGLAFVQETARMHGGKLVITSELNKGSRFSISLPLKNLAE